MTKYYKCKITNKIYVTNHTEKISKHHLVILNSIAGKHSYGTLKEEL